MGKKQQIRKHIFDLDHTLYHEPHDKYDRWIRANQKALSDFGVHLSFQDVKDIGHAAYMAHKHQLSGFIEQYDHLDFEELNRVYHLHAIEEFRAVIVPDQRITDAFNAVAADDKVILTHSIKEWTDAMLEINGMQNSVDPDHILAQCHPEINHERKHESEVPVEVALKVLGSEPGETAMYDDMHQNFKFAHDMGLQTVLIHWGAADKPKKRPKNVSIMAEDITRVLKVK